MEFGGELTLDAVLGAFEEKETGFVSITTKSGGGELELRFSPAALATLIDLSSRRLEHSESGVRLSPYVTLDDVSVDARLDESGGLLLSISDKSAKRTLQISIRDLDVVLKLKEAFDSYLDFRISLAALKGEHQSLSLPASAGLPD